MSIRKLPVPSSIALAIAFLSGGFSTAQTPAARVSFEVASVKLRLPGADGAEGNKRSKMEYNEGRVIMSNVTLQDCVEWAYDLKFYQISAPAIPIDRDRYDIQAKAATPVPVDQLRLMMQDLLQTRFQMTSHFEAKTMRTFELVVAKGGPKLPAAKPDSEISALHSRESLPRVSNGDFIFQDSTIDDFAAKLSLLRSIESPVVDKTGISGVYDIRLKSAATALLDKDGVSLFTLIQEQLGLQLVSVKTPVQILIIDSAEKPSTN